jgi:hypothetical protein
MRAWIYPIDSESQLQPTVHWQYGGGTADHWQWGYRSAFCHRRRNSIQHLNN